MIPSTRDLSEWAQHYITWVPVPGVSSPGGSSGVLRLGRGRQGWEDQYDTNYRQGPPVPAILARPCSFAALPHWLAAGLASHKTCFLLSAQTQLAINQKLATSYWMENSWLATVCPSGLCAEPMPEPVVWGVCDESLPCVENLKSGHGVVWARAEWEPVVLSWDGPKVWGQGVLRADWRLVSPVQLCTGTSGS